MKIIIPMSGFGERFRRVGYKVPKPLINVDNLRIIEHVVNMFSPNEEFIFICNEDHLDNKSYDLKRILKKIVPNCEILGISPHKLGPVYAVLKAKHLINKNEPVVVNYCDFTCYWSWDDFKRKIIKNNYIAAIPAYKGFHPHSLGTTNYAYIKEKNGFLIDIKEKEPFTKKRMNEYASSGTYYFSRGELLISTFEEVIKRKMSVNGEYYVSLAYKIIAEKFQDIFVYPLQHFMQWGTPQDLDEYNFWSDTFKKLSKIKINNNIFKGTLILPMAGEGKRFVKEGYKKVKPIIDISGKPMVNQAIDYLPHFKNNIFIVRKDMKDVNLIIDRLRDQRPNCIIKNLSNITTGQASTVYEGIKELENNHLKGNSIEPITISACDNGVLFDENKFFSTLEKENNDIVVWGCKNFFNAIRNPQMYGWLDIDENNFVRKVSVKTPIDNDLSKPIIIGTFTFKNFYILKFLLEELFKTKEKVNGEFYLDSCIDIAIKNGLNCKYFEIDKYLCWGTPNDLKTFEYWQSCFHKWDYHNYSLKKDIYVPKEKIPELESNIDKFEV